MLKLRRGQAAKVGRQVGFGTDQFAEVDELISAKLVWFEAMIGGGFIRVGVVPEVCAARTLLHRPDAVAPVVAVGETTAGITDDRSLDLFHVVEDVST